MEDDIGRQVIIAKLRCESLLLSLDRHQGRWVQAHQRQLVTFPDDLESVKGCAVLEFSLNTLLRCFGDACKALEEFLLSQDPGIRRRQGDVCMGFRRRHWRLRNDVVSVLRNGQDVSGLASTNVFTATLQAD
ncbi:hypothetical protein CCUS01_11246 [Colletotrichum cuscutae]|uniref:Uncharacterized protein n=1 Tax=Colletotrichum cuscutae TaxID=1209917 RepID=A0AAI9U5Q9_9PEZI|nr:hypothetical protein CCUS01_11246 [Colletotrichum cuscutae]